jgi:hypothetical protein
LGLCSEGKQMTRVEQVDILKAKLRLVDESLEVLIKERKQILLKIKFLMDNGDIK